MKAPQRLKTHLVRDVIFIKLLEHLQELARVAQQAFAGRLHVVENFLRGVVGVGFFDRGDLRSGGFACCRGFLALSRRRRDSSPSEKALGGLYGDFESIRTLRDARAGG